MKTLRVMACVLTLGAALAYTGCGSKYDPPVGIPVPRADGGIPIVTDGGTDGGTEITTFVRDLILDETSDTNAPTSLDDKNLVDSEPANAFPDAFFQ